MYVFAIYKLSFGKTPGANPKTVRFNALVVKIYHASSSLVSIKIVSVILKKRSSLLQRWCYMQL
jgi:hypothetical protein